MIDGIGEVGFFHVGAYDVVGLVVDFVPALFIDAPLSDLFVDDEFGGAVGVGECPDGISAGGEGDAVDEEWDFGGEEGGFICAGAPDLAEGDEAAPDFAGCAGFGIFGVGAAIDDGDAIVADDGADDIVGADAFLLSEGGEGAGGEGGDCYEGAGEAMHSVFSDNDMAACFGFWFFVGNDRVARS